MELDWLKFATENPAIVIGVSVTAAGLIGLAYLRTISDPEYKQVVRSGITYPKILFMRKFFKALFFHNNTSSGGQVSPVENNPKINKKGGRGHSTNYSSSGRN